METLVKKIKAFPLFTGNSGCDYHRIKLPFMFAYHYYDDDTYQGFVLEKVREYMALSEVIVLNRAFPGGIDKLDKFKKEENLDFKVVVDLDDWYMLPDYHPNYRQYKEYAAKEIIENLKYADCVTVTTDRLYQRVKQFNKNCHVIPNAIPFGEGQFTLQPERDDTGPMNFIYTGQSSHLEDVRLMTAGINRASRMKTVSFTLAGWKQHKVWQGIEKVLNQGAEYTRIESKPLNEYMQVYDNADCSLVPLCLNDFNSCKSNLKILEAACKKIPCIVSYVSPYRDDTDAPVLWVKTPDDWYKHIKYLSENREYAKEMGEQLYDWAFERFHLNDWNKVRFEIYQSLIK